MYCYGFDTYRFIGLLKGQGCGFLRSYSFIATVLVPTVLDATYQKMHGVPYLNLSAENFGYGFYFFDRFNAPEECVKTKIKTKKLSVRSKMQLQKSLFRGTVLKREKKR